MFGNRKITSLILLLCLLGILIPGLLNGFSLGMTLFQRVTDEELKESSTVSLMNAHIIDNFVREPHKVLNETIGLIERNRSVMAPETQAILKILTEHYAIFSDIEILDKKGLVLVNASGSSAKIGFSRAGEDYFTKVSPGQKVYWSKTIRTDYSSVPSVTLVIRGDIYIAVAYLNLNELNQIVTDMNESMKNEMKVAVTDRFGIYIAHQDRKRVWQSDFDPHFRDIIAREPGLSDRNRQPLTYGGVPYLISAHRIDGPEWYVITYSPIKRAIDTFLSILPSSLAVLALSLVIVLIPALLSLRRIRKSFRDLNRQTAVIASGRFGQQVSPQYFSEFAILSENFNHMTDNLRERDQTLTEMAYYDKLTGLPNRLYFTEYSQGILSALTQDTRIALLFIDMDNLKTINDSMGHHTGDLILIEVGKRLKSCLRHGDMASRMGGDEFTMLMQSLENMHAIISMAETLVEALGVPYEVNGNPYWFSASIGIALYPDNGQTFDELLRSADAAMYKAKDSGKRTYRFCTTEMQTDLIESFELGKKLRLAMGKGELTALYQPIVSIADGSLRSLEALMRWSVDGISIPPVKFIPLAEETGLIIQMGAWMLREACLHHARWRALGYEGNLSVNISALQLRVADFHEQVSAILTETGMPPGKLELEITEGVLIDNHHEAFSLLVRLKEMGILLSLDDFGTGYSSLSYLQRLPIDVLKIDRSFVQNSLAGENSAVMIEGILHLSRVLHMRTVIEGVETEEQFSFLRSLDCDEIQGWYFSKAVSSEEVERIVSGKLPWVALF